MSILRQEGVQPSYDLEKFSVQLKERVQAAIENKSEFSLEGMPEIPDNDLLPVLINLLREFVEKGDTDSFVILAHTFKKVLDTPAFAWPTEKPSENINSMNTSVSHAIKELWEDPAHSDDGDFLLKVAMKLGIIQQSDIGRIRDMVGVSDTTGHDRI